MKKTVYFLLALSLFVTGLAAILPETAQRAYASENVSDNANNSDDEFSTEDVAEGETAESETELQPVLLDTDQVSTEDILLYSSACVVMDTQTGAILYSKNRSDRHYPASTTKILTTLLALEHSQLTDDVTFSQKAIESITWDSSNMELKPGDELTMEQALYGIMLQSANEAAYGVGEYISGSLEQFAKDMTNYAINLGCRLTNFTNASGLHDDNHYTTAKDLATIARAAAQNEDFRKITGTIMYSVENINYKAKMPESDENDTETADEDGGEAASDELVPDPFLLYNHHKMVNNEYPYEGCYGGKTGYTGEARNTLVTYAKRDDMDLVCVILDCPGGKNYIYMDTELALDYCFENYERLTEEYNAAQALLDYPELGLRDWYHPEVTPLSFEDGLYPNVTQAMDIYREYLHNRQSQEALDKAISEKSVHAFMEYSRLNNYRPLIIAGIILFIAAVVFSLLLVHFVKVLKRKRSRRRYQKLRRQRLMENAAASQSKTAEDADSAQTTGGADAATEAALADAEAAATETASDDATADATEAAATDTASDDATADATEAAATDTASQDAGASATDSPDTPITPFEEVPSGAAGSAALDSSGPQNILVTEADTNAKNSSN